MKSYTPSLIGWIALFPIACVTLFDKNIRFSVYDETETHMEELYYTHGTFKNTNALSGESFRTVCFARIRFLWSVWPSRENRTWQE